jgi:hypothetical protein
MKSSRSCLSSLLAFLIVLGSLSCGGNNRQLQSIVIVGQGGSSTESIINASGTFTSPPTTQTHLPVSWYLLGPGLDPPPAGYQLTNQSFVLPCGGYTAIAVAPTAPNAASSGPIPQQVFQDLVLTQTKSSEGGFVAASLLSGTRC